VRRPHKDDALCTSEDTLKVVFPVVLGEQECLLDDDASKAVDHKDEWARLCVVGNRVGGEFADEIPRMVD